MSCFEHTLADHEVYECFASIVAKARKFASAEMKDAVAEFEESLAEIHGKGTEDAEAASKAAKMVKKAAKVRAKKGKKGKAALAVRDENTAPHDQVRLPVSV